MIPTLILVGADKGGVGKTTITRILLDYLKDKGARPSVYDTEGALRRFYSYAKPVDIETVAGQMEIFDAVPTAGLTVVDMKAGSLSPTLRAMRNAGKLDKTDQGKERLVILHVLGSNKQSMEEIVDTHALLAEGGEHVLIENHAAKDGTFFKWHDDTRKSFFQFVTPAAQFEVPHLDTLASEDVDRCGSSFAGYIKNAGEKKHSDYLSRIVRHWRDLSYPRFDELKLVG